MNPFTVRYDPEAVAEIEESYLWGVENWGAEVADQWLRDFYHSVSKRLASMPQRFPIAPESPVAGREIRQIIHGRYRVLFVIEQQDVIVLNLHGPFVPPLAG